jgi:hypothetical protein
MSSKGVCEQGKRKIREFWRGGLGGNICGVACVMFSAYYAVYGAGIE